MKPVTSSEMSRLDQAAIERFAVPSLLLMENAGRGVSNIVSSGYKPCGVLVVCGKGNNGGDGLVAARHLTDRGFSVRILMLEDPAKLKSDPLVNYRLAEKMRIPVHLLTEKNPQSEIKRICSGAELIVDAIVGTGLTRDLRGTFLDAVKAINASGKPVISIDIPSGLDSDSGEVHGAAVKASITVTLALPKVGLYSGQGPEHAGKIEIVDIGMPRELLAPYLD